MHIIWDSMVETGKITVTDYVRVTSTECAKIFNICPRKGAILEGSDADIIILNPKRSFAMGTRTHHSRSDTNVYEGRKGKGMVEVTISRGRVVWEDGLNKGNCLVGTDHCTFNSTQKAFGSDDFRKIPNGVNGIEERMHIIWDSMVETGKITVTDYVRVTSTECAKIFNIYPRKGAILEGSDADIIILNPKRSFAMGTRTHHSRSDTNVYEGRKGKGMVEVTISRGRVVWEDGLNKGNCLVGTDHCTFNSTQKAFGSDDFRKISNGVNGIEERMHIIWDSMVETGKITVTDYVRVTSTECAKIFNIYPRKGAILEGSDADIIILNPKRSFAMGTRTHHSRSDTNVYEGRKGKGMVEVTISRGRVVWEDGLNKGNCLVGTDHCTFNSTQKAFGSDDFRKIPNGVNGIEERMHIIWDSMVETGKITVTDYVRVTSIEW
ncbi:uncharacterized protein [Triticum aestivum]|uniref:uncharacterized protein n=1 Tax=Triticum aestivum TaxID=4565 RepID=UPI001D02208D|nr:uncharacterized protein LOC123170978 [Triticum aestivum]